MGTNRMPRKHSTSEPRKGFKASSAEKQDGPLAAAHDISQGQNADAPADTLGLCTNQPGSIERQETSVDGGPGREPPAKPTKKGRKTIPTATRRERCHKRYFLKKSILKVQDMNPEVAGHPQSDGKSRLGCSLPQQQVEQMPPLQLLCPPGHDSACEGLLGSDNKHDQSTQRNLHLWSDGHVILERIACHTPQPQDLSELLSNNGCDVPVDTCCNPSDPESLMSGHDHQLALVQHEMKMPLLSSADDQALLGCLGALSTPETYDLEALASLDNNLNDMHDIATVLASQDVSPFHGTSQNGSCVGSSNNSSRVPSNTGSNWRPCSTRTCINTFSWAEDIDSMEQLARRALRRHPVRSISTNYKEDWLPTTVYEGLPPLLQSSPGSNPGANSGALHDLLQRLPATGSVDLEQEEFALPLFNSPTNPQAGQGWPGRAAQCISLDPQHVVKALCEKEASGEIWCSPPTNISPSPLFRPAQSEQAEQHLFCHQGKEKLAPSKPACQLQSLDQLQAHGQQHPICSQLSNQPGSPTSLMSSAEHHMPVGSSAMHQGTADGQSVAWAESAFGWSQNHAGGAVPLSNYLANKNNESLEYDTCAICQKIMLAHFELLGLCPADSYGWLDSSGRIATQWLSTCILPVEVQVDVAALPIKLQVCSFLMHWPLQLPAFASLIWMYHNKLHLIPPSAMMKCHRRCQAAYYTCNVPKIGISFMPF
jgi:hypothetical protein